MSNHVAVDSDDETFLEKILTIDFMDIFYNIDTFNLFRVYDWRNQEMVQQMLKEYAQKREHVQVLKGRDLESIGVKHYQFSEISKYVDRCPCIAALRDGRVYRGVLEYGGEPRIVTIKVWRINGLPMGPHLRFYPARLYNDIYLLKKKLNFEEYLPKLIGYSIDKVLAVVYDIPAEKCLFDELYENFSLEDRMLVALGVAHALQLFHNQNMRFGPLNPRNVILDKDMNVYLCNFGLCADVKDKIDDDAVKCGLFDCDIWKYSPYELCTKEEWLMESDIYSYGVLLLEIISNVELEAYNFLPTWAEEKIQSGRSLFHESFNGVDEATRLQISELLKDCTNDDMVKRPTIASLIDRLEKLNFFDDSSPFRKKPKLEQESEFVI